jgi:hypothetical protein
MPARHIFGASYGRHYGYEIIPTIFVTHDRRQIFVLIVSRITDFRRVK